MFASAPMDTGANGGSSLDGLFSQLQSRSRPNTFTGQGTSAPQGAVANLDSSLDPLWSQLQGKVRQNGVAVEPSTSLRSIGRPIDSSLPPLRSPLQPRARPRNDGEHMFGGGYRIEEPSQASGGTQAGFGHSLEPGFVPTLARVLVTGGTADSNGFDNHGSTAPRPWTTSRELTCSRPTVSSQARRRRPGTVATGKKFDEKRNQAAELKVSDIRGYSGLDDLFSSHWVTPDELSRDALQSRQQSRQKEDDSLGLLSARSVAASSPVEHSKNEQPAFDSEGAGATPRSRFGIPVESPGSPPGGIKLSGASFAHALGLATEREVLANLGEEDSDRLMHLKNLKTKMQANTTISVETAMREFGKSPGSDKDGDSDAGVGGNDSLFSKRPPSPLRPGVYVGHEERARTAKSKKRMPKGLMPPKPLMEEAAAEEETREEEMPTASKKKADKIRQRVNLHPYLNGPKSKEDKAEDHISAEERETYALWKKKVLQCARNMKQEVDRFRFG